MIYKIAVLILVFNINIQAADKEKVADIASWITVSANIAGQIAENWNDSSKRCSYGRQALSTGLTIGISELIKHYISKERPDKSDNESFPSEHTAIAFANSGWKIAYGISLGIGTGAGRIVADKHDYIDVSVGAGIGIGTKLLSDKLINCSK